MSKHYTEYKYLLRNDGKFHVESHVHKNGVVYKNFVSEFATEQEAKNFCFTMNLTA